MHYKIPESCCKSDADPDQCMLSTKVTLKSIITSDIYSQVRELTFVLLVVFFSSFDHHVTYVSL